MRALARKLGAAGRLARRAGRDAGRRVRSSAAGRLVGACLAAARRARLRRELRHLWGPEPLRVGPEEAVAVCLARNAEPWLRAFVDHHLALGVRQIVLLDNGSDDRTLELARRHERVTVLRSRLPYRLYQFTFKEHLLRRYGVGGWRLHLDADELFDYPRSAQLPLGGLLAYLNAGGYSAVVAYLLDMFGEGPLRGGQGGPGEDLRARYPYYDITEIGRRPYADHYGDLNHVSNPAIELYWGGIRGALFGSYDWLTKHPLLHLEAGARPAGNVAHDVHGARVADLSAVLYHYKFVDGFAEQAARAVRERSHYGGSRQYRRYVAALAAQPDLRARRETARRLGGVDELLAQGFLAVSPAYEAWVAGRAREAAA